MGSLRLLGRFSLDQTEAILRQALTREGAEALSSNWLGSVPEWLAKDDEAISMVQGSAAAGLVYTQKPDNVELVRQAYETEHLRCVQRQANSELRNQLADAMADRDLISEMGIDRFWALHGQHEFMQKSLNAVGKYAYVPPK
jgi:hypothetical protein